MKSHLTPLFVVASLVILYLVFFQAPVSAAPSNNPIFASIDGVKQMIAASLSPIQSSIQALSNRVSTIEATATPIPKPPFKGIWVSTLAISATEPGGLGNFIYMIPRLVANNDQKIPADCWATVHYPNGDATGLTYPNRDNPIQVVSPNQALPTNGTKIPIDLYCSWGGSTLQFHFEEVWDLSASTQIHTSY